MTGVILCEYIGHSTTNAVMGESFKMATGHAMLYYVETL